MDRPPIPEATNRVAEQIVDAALRVHRALGPGLLESVYELCLIHELQERGLNVERQVPVSIRYGSLHLPHLRLDLCVEKCVVVEIKAVETVLPVHEAQLLSYLKLSGHRVGLLMNFHGVLLKDGLRRRVW